MPRAPPAPIATQPTEFAAATTALKNANDAVRQRDYRLALNHALESREQAQNAARDAADTRAASAARSSARWRKSPPCIAQVSALDREPGEPRARRVLGGPRSRSSHRALRMCKKRAQRCRRRTTRARRSC